ncbi:MAG: amidohydrolase family protein [Sphingomonadales bacterium]|nr:amidohydrolase family protein [Sphingomonadales bacterium]
MKHFTFLIAAFLFASTGSAEVTVYKGGPIITMAGDEAQTVEAVAVDDGKIIAVGTAAAVNKKAGKKAKQVDLAGRTMLPGFIDAHGHVSAVGMTAGLANLSPPPVGGVSKIGALQDTLRNYKRPEGMPIIIGWGYDDSLIDERRHPTRQELDAVSATTPIMITHASGHLGVMNSAMLKLVGITADTPNPVGGVIRREDDGKTPNGVLEETAWFENLKMLAPRSPEASLPGLLAGAKIYAASGITTAQDGRVMPENWATLAIANDQNKLPIDIVVLIAGESDWPEEIQALVGKPSKGHIRIGGIKLVLDGSPQGRTAWLRDPVPVPPEGQGPDYHGYGLMSPETLTAKLKWVADNGWQLFAHVNGDAAAQALIDGVRGNGLSGKRTIAIHNQVVRPEQLAAMAELDIQPSFFANHTFFWGDWHREVSLGSKRADFISPQASAWAIGLRPTAHNDSPVVPTDIMRLVWSSVNRRTRSGDILGPLERISPYRALQQVTINAAWQIHEDDSKGSIAVGKRADLVILDRNPFTVDPAEIDKIKVVATIKDGVFVHGSLPTLETERVE